MERVKGRSRKGNPSIVRGHGKIRRLLSVLACACLVTTNVLGSAIVTYADTAESSVQEFRVSGKKLQDAVLSAVRHNKPLDEDEFRFAGDESSSYEELLDTDGTLYALKYAPEKDAGKLQLKSYVRLPEAPVDPDNYLISGEEEIIFVLSNGTDRELTGRIMAAGRRSEDIAVAAKDFFEVEEELFEETVAAEEEAGSAGEEAEEKTNRIETAEPELATLPGVSDPSGTKVTEDTENPTETKAAEGTEEPTETEVAEEKGDPSGTKVTEDTDKPSGIESEKEAEEAKGPENSVEGGDKITVENEPGKKESGAETEVEILGESSVKPDAKKSEKTAEPDADEPEDTAEPEKTESGNEEPEVSVSLHRTVRVMAAASAPEAGETEAEETGVNVLWEATPPETEEVYIEGNYYDSVLLNGKAAAAFAVTLNALEEEESVYTAEAENAVVETVVPVDAFEVPVTLTARALAADSEEYAEVEAQIGAQGYRAQKITAYDICFVNEDGEEIEPNGEVKVRIHITDAAMAEGLAEKPEETTLLHIHEEQLKELSDAVVETTGEGKARAEFTTSEFSIIAFLAEAKQSVSIKVDQNAEVQDGSSYHTIQDAVNYIVWKQKKETEEADWVINVAEGTYARFLIPHGVKNITVQGCGESTIISTFDNSVIPNVEVLQEGNTDPYHNSDGKGIIVWGADITLKDMKIISDTETAAWYSSAVGTNDGMWGSSDELDTSVILDNCIFEGSGKGFAFMPQRSRFTVNNCRITNYAQAIYFAADGFAADNCVITDNRIENCIFAIHGYYGDGVAKNAMQISGNTISGTADRFAVIAVMDQSNTGAVKMDIKGNTFSYTIVGGINQRKEGGNPMETVMSSNTFNNYSYVADAYWYSATDYGTTFYAPKQEGKIATWYGNPTTEAGTATQELIEAALEEYGTAGQVIEINAPAQETFTIGKNALIIKQYVEAGDLQISKTVVGNTVRRHILVSTNSTFPYPSNQKQQQNRISNANFCHCFFMLLYQVND